MATDTHTFKVSQARSDSRNVPDTVGVPLIVSPDKLRPAGKVPDRKLQVYGPVPPAAVEVKV